MPAVRARLMLFASVESLKVSPSVAFVQAKVYPAAAALFHADWLNVPWFPETSTPAMRASINRGSRVSATAEPMARRARNDGFDTDAAPARFIGPIAPPDSYYETQTTG